MGKIQNKNDLQTRPTSRWLVALSLAASLAAFGAEATPKVRTHQRSIRHSAEEAAAIMAGRAPLRGRYLGPASPASSGRAYASDSVGGFVNPAMLTNPQLTINSSISSSPTAAINSGAGEAVATGSVAATSVTGTTAAATIAGTGLTTTAATTTALPAGTFATASPTATESIVNNSPVTAASTLTTAASGVRLVRGATGVTITNASAGTSPTTASSSRSQ